MREPRKSLPYRRMHAVSPFPRVNDDLELYSHVMANATVKIGTGETPRPDQVSLVHELTRDWCKPWSDAGVAVMICRARLFLGCMRRELARRNNLNPNQIRLLEGT